LEEHDQNRIYRKDDTELDDAELLARRDFLHSLMKWSSVLIGGVVFGTASAPIEVQAGWVNRRGSWVNGAGAGGWVNRGASWVNGGGSWANSGTNWINRGGSWINGGGGWANRSGGGWLNNRGGGGWINRRG